MMIFDQCEMNIVAYLGILLSANFIHAAHDSSFCKEITPSEATTDVKFPDVPSYFRSSVEANILNTNTTISIREYCADYRGAILIMGQGTKQRVLYDYSVGEGMVVDETKYSSGFDLGACTVYKLSNSSSELFGKSIKGVGGIKLFGPSVMFKFGQGLLKQFKSSTKVRNIDVNHWYTCAWIKDIDASVKVDWYFTADDWNTPDYKTNRPVRITVDGQYNFGEKRRFQHSYDITDYTQGLDNVHMSILRIPNGVVCPGRKKLKKVDPTPKSFSYELESIGIDGISLYSTEEYDSEIKMSRFDFYPISQYKKDAVYGNGLLTRIHDFNTGVQFVLNNDLGNCTYGPIDESGDTVSSTVGNAHLVRMKAPQDFFMSDKDDYYYNGPVVIRGISTDSYIFMKTVNFLHTDNKKYWMNATQQWYFATNFNISQDGIVETSLPVRMIYATEWGSDDRNYNFFNFLEKEPSYQDYSVAHCFENHKTKHFTITFTSKEYQTNSILKRPRPFKYWLVVYLHRVLTISYLRISNIEAFADNKNLLKVMFTIAEKAPVEGNVADPVKELSLSDTASKLKSLVDSRDFTFSYRDGDTIQTLAADPRGYFESDKRVLENKVGYTPGDMIGIGIVTLFIGFFVGLFLFYVVRRIQVGGGRRV